jgi:diketogulonate reductase-like aldo/keto reductase
VHPVVREIARRHGVTPAQVALAWVLDHPGIVAIPRSADPSHVAENRAALDLVLTALDIAELTRAFPPPVSPQPLEVL